MRKLLKYFGETEIFDNQISKKNLMKKGNKNAKANLKEIF